jgi:hypothetical protein
MAVFVSGFAVGLFLAARWWQGSRFADFVEAKQAAVPVLFEAEIEPIFKTRCYECHGARVQEAGLRLDQKVAAFNGGDSGPAIVPGDSDQSLLFKVVAGHDPDRAMPPVGPALSELQIAWLQKWIDQGADWPDALGGSDETHWSFRPIVAPGVPSVANTQWPRNPIDQFVLATLEHRQIAPSASASRETLIRRLSLDLTGLPPSPGEVADFVDDQRPDAYEHLVERLLRSLHYGEKWARHWLDQVRYADSDGFEIDFERPNAWRYRHWVIDALNSDMPFDDFTIQQIAGDLLQNNPPLRERPLDLPPDTPVSNERPVRKQVSGGPASEEFRPNDASVGTGMLRNAPLNREAGIKVEQSRFEQMLNRVDTLSTVWLGLTMRCAQCHDHKYDPLKQDEFYKLFAFLNSTIDVEADAPLPGDTARWEACRDEYEAKRQALLDEHDFERRQEELEVVLREVAVDPDAHYPSRAYKLFTLISAYVSNAEQILFTPPDKRSMHERDAFVTFFLDKQIKLPELEQSLADLRAAYPLLSAASVVRELDAPPVTHIRNRGDFFQPGEAVEPGTPTALHPLDRVPEQRLTRLDLARWIMSPENPLTARVIVNRHWGQFFGRPLVTTSGDFGVQGERPSHPELLDWLATEFRRSNWSLKHLHRQIVLSATYRQSSQHRPELQELDPDNALLARQNRQRLPAELIRDVALTVSGLLNDSIGGRSIKPPQPDGIAELSEGGAARWKTTLGAERFKRGLYIHFQRTTPYPFLINFDTPEMTRSVCVRDVSTTPLQALNLLNDPVFFEAATVLGLNLHGATRFEPEQRIVGAFLKCVSRMPTPRELKLLTEFHALSMHQLQTTSGAADELCPRSIPEPERVQAAAWILLARVMLNMDETLNRE